MAVITGSPVISGKTQRDEIWEYPLEAVREIVINMIVHRDYRASTDSAIKIFNDRIEIFNPGGPPPEIRMEDILSGRVASMPRNKQIASVFKEAGIIEKYGTRTAQKENPNALRIHSKRHEPRRL